MVVIDAIMQNILLILRDPAWQGAGVVVSSALSVFAIFHTQSSEQNILPNPILKKVHFDTFELIEYNPAS